jgi:hypothetical protein
MLKTFAGYGKEDIVTLTNHFEDSLKRADVVLCVPTYKSLTAAEIENEVMAVTLNQ